MDSSSLLSLKVQSVRQETHCNRVYTLVPANAGPLPEVSAGAHLTLHLPSGLERQYSICSDPVRRDAWQIAVKREDDGRGGSIEVHQSLTEGSVVPASGPDNHFPLPDGDAPILLLAGGIGITPIAAMIHQLRNEGRTFRLVYMVRSVGDVMFRDLLEQRHGEHLEIHITEAEERRADLDAILTGSEPGTHVQCCGPLPMIEEVQQITERLGWDPELVRRAVFRIEDNPVHEGDQPFTVTLASSGREIAVAGDQTILDALLSAGVDVDFSCEEGTCGTCITRVLSGTIDHRDQVLMANERKDHITICCSRSGGGNLTLDL